MVHAFRLVVVVVVCRRHSAIGALVLLDRPVLNEVIAPVDRADLVIASITMESAHLCALGARIVAAVVLKNLSI